MGEGGGCAGTTSPWTRHVKGKKNREKRNTNLENKTQKIGVGKTAQPWGGSKEGKGEPAPVAGRGNPRKKKEGRLKRLGRAKQARYGHGTD